MSQPRLESDDDTSDDDYVPGGADCTQLSEVESDGDPEDDCNSENESNSKHKKRKSKTKNKKSKKPKPDIVEDEETEEEPVKLSEEEQKKKTDSLWADFLKDTDFKPKPKSAATITENKLASKTVTNEPPIKEKSSKKETVPIILEFAGEKVNIPDKANDNTLETQSTSSPSISNFPAKKPRGGMSSVLSQLGKKQKITTLEKSKLDWDRFKQDENIADELHAFNKGKNGYLDRQDFLQRADLRQFELEKKARAVQRSHRS